MTTLDALRKTPGVVEDGEQPLLSVRGLSTHFFTDAGVVKAVEDVSFDVMPGTVLAIVGESGSGKSVTSMSILGLVPDPPGRIVAGEILFEGENLVEKTAKELRSIRGNRIAMIFQDPMTSLDPVFTVEDQMVETIVRHQGATRAAARKIALDMLARVHIPDPARRLGAYPFELSGGLRQRVMIAMALSCQPSLLIADEPTTALDVTVQAQILSLLRELQSEFHMAVILITHDFGVVSRLADRVVVMYAGRVMEAASREAILESPQHPYTQALLRSRPKLGDKARLISIPGTTPNLTNPPPGCPFANRCSEMTDPCWAGLPVMRGIGPDHVARCLRRGEGDG